MEISFISQSQEETVQYGKILGKTLVPSSVVGLVGELGSGKTCFIKGLASGVNNLSEHEVASPTYTILNSFEGKIPFYHFDLYRIDNFYELDEIGFDEYLYGEGVVAIEWVDKIEHAMPPEWLKISIDCINEKQRYFIYKAYGEKYNKILQLITKETGRGL